MELYADDLDEEKLVTQLSVLRKQVEMITREKEELTLDMVIEAIRKTPNFHEFLSEVVKLAKLVLVAAATNATSERSFSALRCVKTYLRSSMTQARLNHLLILHVHKDVCDKLDWLNVANDFVKGSEHRRQLFGQF